jgi:hypothetical protein
MTKHTLPVMNMTQQAFLDIDDQEGRAIRAHQRG